MILHIVPAFGIEATEPCCGGVAPRLCEALIAAGVNTTLAVLDWNPSIELPTYVRRFPLAVGLRRLGHSPAMARWLMEQTHSGRVDLIHSHGLWMMPNVYPAWLRRDSSCRLLVSPHGTVSDWALNHHWLRKRLFWHLAQAQTLRRGDAFHAATDREYEELRRLGFHQPIAVVPNGVEIPPFVKSRRWPVRRLLYFGRIHKIKGIDILVRAWHSVQKRFPNWELVIAGPDDGGYLKRYQKLVCKLKVERVNFLGPKYGEAKLELYHSASLYVLPSHSENFGNTVAEALAAGIPAIVTKGAPWSGLIEHDAGWWIDVGLDPLIDCLEKALSLPEERLQEMGLNGRTWMAEEFSWIAITRQMIEFYSWLCGRGERPSFVRLD